MEKRIQIIAIAVAIVVAGIIYLCMNYEDEESLVVTEGFSDAVTKTAASEPVGKTEHSYKDSVYIHICGAVKKPGVYTFDKEPRLNDVVKKAGGFSKNADQSSINLASIVKDGTQIIIDSISKKSKKSKSLASANTKSKDVDKININTATKEELMTLAGIGESKANQIISYRESNGLFKSIEDIMKISGIKEGVFSKIKDSIVV